MKSAKTSLFYVSKQFYSLTHSRTKWTKCFWTGHTAWMKQFKFYIVLMQLQLHHTTLARHIDQTNASKKTHSCNSSMFTSAVNRHLTPNLSSHKSKTSLLPFCYSALPDASSCYLISQTANRSTPLTWLLIQNCLTCLTLHAMHGLISCVCSYFTPELWNSLLCIWWVTTDCRSLNVLGSVKQVHLNNEDEQEGRLCANTYTTGLKQITQAVLHGEEKQRHILPTVLCRPRPMTNSFL